MKFQKRENWSISPMPIRPREPIKDNHLLFVLFMNIDYFFWYAISMLYVFFKKKQIITHKLKMLIADKF